MKHPCKDLEMAKDDAKDERGPKKIKSILAKAGKRALGGGLPGFVAMILQVVLLMWLRTLVNYQYSRGGSFSEAFRKLYAEGGIKRLYAGFWAAVIVGPLCRFGDTAANAGILSVLEARVPVGLATMLASTGAALWRVFLQPVQNMKTIMQVEGSRGAKILAAKVGERGVGVLWEGALGGMGATWLGHYPWFLTYNTLNGLVPDTYTGFAKLGRNAAIGFCCSFVSDLLSNFLRVITTSKQTSAVVVTYTEVARAIIAKDGILGLMGRGLGTKILSNGVSAMLFSVLWRYFQAKFEARAAKKKSG
mmetsp:Transcript_49441/g.96684  ORF Transcript_49441/g.96684 Transcript_49441/m.96684 type:complete len:305 (+) Transcript_49441:1-915(+)